ncbi:hypothetical protein [Saccharopolyspora sp. NPDC002376]
MAGDDHVQRIVDLAGWQGPCTWRLDWLAIETALGHALPSDYKRLCERLPPGRFGGFLNLLHPASVSDDGNLLVEERFLKEPDGLVDMLVEQERIDTEEANADRLSIVGCTDGTVADPPTGDDEAWQPLFGPGQLHPCFLTDNGDYGYWIAAEHDPEEWNIGINYSRTGTVEWYEHSLSSLIHKMLTDDSHFFAALDEGPLPQIFTPFTSGALLQSPPLTGPAT